ncbi:Flp pilus assembly complex ATPase component TadA [bacterium]|nr:Flp pilus assembly complex ATPase component TadA [bacterium]
MEEIDAITPLPAGPDEAPAWLARVIAWAGARRATDLHFFPGEADAALWARIDGQLREAARYSLSIHERLVARLKVLGRCTDYSGDPIQEGRFQLNGQASGGEARLSVLPTLRGEKAVVRLIGGALGPLRLEELGLSETLITRLRAATDIPQGLILAIGPSGCGKSTTLYSLLADLAERAGGPVSILTIEDPIERSLPCAAQIAADPARGLTFVSGLRALLRQDPEVIMIGEIRDAETANTALQAALTGHRLLSSMHTLTPAEALVRLRQMGAPAYVIASALAGVVNVRLMRLICPDCRQWREPSEEEKDLFPALGVRVADGNGCDRCLGVGRLGRTGIGEWLEPTSATAAALAAGEPASAIAPTLGIGVGAREGFLDALRRGLVAPGEITRLTGLVSLFPSREGQA